MPDPHDEPHKQDKYDAQYIARPGVLALSAGLQVGLVYAASSFPADVPDGVELLRGLGRHVALLPPAHTRELARLTLRNAHGAGPRGSAHAPNWVSFRNQ